jgi:DUF1707 SHOCT-like domain
MAMRYYAPFPGGGGEPPRSRGPHALRIGDAERDAAAADLGEHYAAGRLTLDELNERLDAVFATKTLGQLTRIMADLPGPGRLAWHARPGGAGTRPGFVPWDAWGPAGHPYAGSFGPTDMPWPRPGSPVSGFQPRAAQAQQTPSDRAGRFAALSLLLLAMLIWLFTALLFARHGFYQPPGPMQPTVPVHHFFQQGGP